jgi:hypothetical protein
MTRRSLAFALALVPALIMLGTPAKASALDAAQALIANVPFSFVAGGTMLPAGRYEVRTGSDPAVIWFISPDGRHAAAVATEWGGSPFEGNQPRLKFDVYGHTHFLSMVRVPGENARLIPVTPNVVESELAKLDEQGALARVRS